MPLPDLNPRAASALRSAVAATLDDSLLNRVLPAALPPKPPTPAAAAKPAQANRISGPAARNTAPQSAAPRHTAQHGHRAAGAKTNPMRATAPRGAAGPDGPPLKPVQLSGARLLLQGKTTTEVAAELGVHRYTVTRWQSDPRFQAELRRQVDRATWRNTAPQSATLRRAGEIEPTRD